MANIKSAKKRYRQSEKRRERNRYHVSTLRTRVKQLLKAIESGDKEAAGSALTSAFSKIDRSAKLGVVHKNKADRLKSRLNVRFNRAFS